MIATDTADIAATATQVKALAKCSIDPGTVGRTVEDHGRATYGGEPSAPHLRPERWSIHVKSA